MKIKLGVIFDQNLRAGGGFTQSFQTVKFLNSMSNDKISAELIKIKGIGQWTADMFLMFTLARPDVFPYGDLGIQKGLMELNKMDRLPTRKEMELEARQWKPYRTMAALYLWKIVDGPLKW